MNLIILHSITEINLYYSVYIAGQKMNKRDTIDKDRERERERERERV